MAIPVGWILGLLALLPRRNPDPLGFGLEDPEPPRGGGTPPPPHGMTKPAPTKPSTVRPSTELDPAVLRRVSTQPTPWPAAKPAAVPPFPSAEWVYDEPPPKAVQARALQLLPQLHKKGLGAHVTEWIDGRWISFVARMNQNLRAVEAYRLRTAPRVVPVRGAVRPVRPAAPNPDLVHASTPVVRPEAPTAPPLVPVSTQPGAAGPVPATVMLGSKGPTVERAQRALGVVMKPGAPYGTFGEYTRQAAITYQRAHGLEPDGVVGPATWSALLYGSSPTAPASGPLSPSSGLLA